MQTLLMKKIRKSMGVGSGGVGIAQYPIVVTDQKQVLIHTLMNMKCLSVRQ